MPTRKLLSRIVLINYSSRSPGVIIIDLSLSRLKQYTIILATQQYNVINNQSIDHDMICADVGNMNYDLNLTLKMVYIKLIHVKLYEFIITLQHYECQKINLVMKEDYIMVKIESKATS